MSRVSVRSSCVVVTVGVRQVPQVAEARKLVLYFGKQPIMGIFIHRDRRRRHRHPPMRPSHEFNELYQLLLMRFTWADNDFDGKIRLRDFDAMVELAANLPSRFGFAPTG